MGMSVSDIDAGNSHLYPGSTGGVIISEIVEGRQAWHSGLRKGDVISEVNREPVNSTQEFFDTASHQIDSVLLFISRTSYIYDLSGKVEKSLLTEISYVDIHTTHGGERIWDPVYGRINSIDGILISEIDEDSQAWNSGLRKGDIIFAATKSLMSIFHKKIRNTEDFVGAVNGFKKSFRVLIWRPQQQEIYLVLD
jgi:S1-C subfamily serine protease